jgi:hypothetical protein
MMRSPFANVANGRQRPELQDILAEDWAAALDVDRLPRVVDDHDPGSGRAVAGGRGVLG